MSQLRTVKLSASTKFCYNRDKVVKVNIKETFMRNHGFLEMCLW